MKCRKPSHKNVCGAYKRIDIFPGKGTGEDASFSQWSMEKLRERVKLVQEAVFFAQNYTVQDEEYQVTRTRKVLVPVG